MKKVIIQNPFGEDFHLNNLETIEECFNKTLMRLNELSVFERDVIIEEVYEEYGCLDEAFFEEKLEGTGYRVEII